MASIDFPDYGRVMTNQFTEQNTPNVLRTTFESGHEKQVARSGVSKTVMSVTYLFTLSEYATFKSWFYNTAKQGALFFNAFDPLDDVEKEFRIVNGQFNTTPLTLNMTAVLVSMQWERYDV